MIQLLSLLLMGCLTTGCITYVKGPSEPVSELERHRRFFERVTGHNTRAVSIQWMQNPMEFNGALGVCFPLTKEVFINRRAFQDMGTNRRRAVVSHELIHCHLYIGHSDPDNEEFSLMAPYMWQGKMKKKLLMDELMKYRAIGSRSSNNKRNIQCGSR